MVEHPLVQPYLKRIEGTMEGIMGLDSATVGRLLNEFV
jgi:septum formation protein